MKICIIAVNKDDYAPKRIFEEGLRLGHQMHLTTWLDVCLDVRDSSIFFGDSIVSFSEFDAIIPRSPNFTAQRKGRTVQKRLGSLFRLLIEFARKKNIYVLNHSFFSQYQSQDKLAQQFFLFSNDLPGISSSYFSTLGDFERKFLSLPTIFKSASGSLGKGVHKAATLPELKALMEKCNTTGKNFLLQKYCTIKSDYRVLVIGGKAVGAMRRTSQKNEWRTNVSLGGKVSVVSGESALKLCSLAEKVAKKMSLDYVGVDILNDRGVYRIIEINSLAQFRGFEKAFPKINVAANIIGVVKKGAVLMNTKRSLF